MPRPMTDQADYVTGAFTPRTWRKAADVKLRESTTPLTASQPLGIVPVQGAFMDLGNVNIDAHYGLRRWVVPYTVPIAEFPITPILPQYKDQVQNPYTINGQPGYTSAVPVSLGDRVTQMLSKNYTGVIG